MAQIAIIGAGVAGLAAAGELAWAGHAPTLFEKSRGVGGRVATRRVGAFTIDHGAQIVKAPTLHTLALVGEVAGATTLADPVWVFTEDGPPRPGDPTLADEPLWVYPGGNTALARHMAAGLTIRLTTAVTAMRREGAGYMIRDAAGVLAGPFDAVLLTAPAPQSAAIIASSDLDPGVRSELLAALAPVRYRPCLSIALAYPRRPALPWYALLNVDRRHPIAWLACEHAKPGRAPEGQSLMLAQMAHVWSEAHWDTLPKGLYGGDGPAMPAPAAEVHALVAALVGAGLGEPLWADVHRWRYALCDAPCGPAALEGRRGIYLAGDLEAGQGRVHLALESGWAAARRIIAGLS
jgi:renalase